jgi:hypothetical protein
MASSTKAVGASRTASQVPKEAAGYGRPGPKHCYGCGAREVLIRVAQWIQVVKVFDGTAVYIRQPLMHLYQVDMIAAEAAALGCFIWNRMWISSRLQVIDPGRGIKPFAVSHQQITSFLLK